jgi:hypothetical protein
MIRFPLLSERAWRTPIRLLLPLLLLLAGCDWRGSQTLPAQMVGDWRTDEPRYHGRLMRLETDRITFVLGGVVPDNTELIENVRMASSSNPTDYTLHLKARDGTEESIVLQFTPQNGGELRLNSQSKVVWKRKSQIAGTTPGAPQGETSQKEAPQQGTPAANRGYGEHVTIYKIDCLKPKACRSF